MFNVHHKLPVVDNAHPSLSVLLAQLASISMVISVHLVLSPLKAVRSVLTQLIVQHAKVVSTWIRWEPTHASSAQHLLLVVLSAVQIRHVISARMDTT